MAGAKELEQFVRDQMMFNGIDLLEVPMICAAIRLSTNGICTQNMVRFSIYHTKSTFFGLIPTVYTFLNK